MRLTLAHRSPHTAARIFLAGLLAAFGLLASAVASHVAHASDAAPRPGGAVVTSCRP